MIIWLSRYISEQMIDCAKKNAKIKKMIVNHFFQIDFALNSKRKIKNFTDWKFQISILRQAIILH